MLTNKKSSLSEELQNDDIILTGAPHEEATDEERHDASNRPKIHSLFHITDSIQTRGLPEYHSTDS